MTTKIIDQLNSFLRGEISAVETHKMAIEKLAKSTFVPVLRDTLASHKKRVGQLRDEITKLGGEPAEGSGAWGTFAKLFEGGAAAFGEKAAIAALEEGEDHGRNDYQSGLDEMTPPTREFVAGLLGEQLKTHAAISNLKRTMSNDTPRYQNP
jgi:uncharacterized protein (TIGR02284 family)